MSKGQTSAVISIVLSAVIALLAVFGYNVLVVQPQMDALEAQVEGPTTANFNALDVDSLSATDLTVSNDPVIGGVTLAATDPLTISGVLTDVVLLYDQQ